MGYPVVHFEVNGTDGPALERYYAELFGWRVQPMEGAGYAIVDTQSDEGIDGGIGTAQQVPTGTMVYVAVPDIDATVQKIEALGGKRLMDTVVMPGIVTFTHVADPEGNRIGLVLDGEGPERSKGDGAAVGWFEILGTDGPALRAFYAEVFGWSFKESSGDGFDYGEADTRSGGRGIPGGVGRSQGEPVTTAYAGVDDVAKYLERAESLGGTKVMGPMDVGAGTEIGAFRDPQGNLFGVYKHVHPH